MADGWNLCSTSVYYLDLEQELRRLLLGFKIGFSRWLIIPNENFDWQSKCATVLDIVILSFLELLISKTWIGFLKLHVSLASK